MSLKKAFEKKLEAQMNEWDAEVEKLKAKAQKAEADAQIEFYKRIEDLKEKRETAKAKLAELKDAGEEAWQDLKTGIDTTWKKLGDAVKAAVDYFK